MNESENPVFEVNKIDNLYKIGNSHIVSEKEQEITGTLTHTSWCL